MIKEPTALPVTRTWRDIPQKVKPRAMSREGRRRLVMGTAKAVLGIVTLGALGWAGFQVRASLKGDDSPLAPTENQEPIGDRVSLATDGVLDRAWLLRTLDLPRGATLMSLNLRMLSARLTASGQVSSASLVRDFPAHLIVRLAERSPVARLRVRLGQEQSGELLVARDGVAFEGRGFDPSATEQLPWIDGVTLSRKGAGYAPIEGMDRAAELLARARTDAASLYRNWKVVSLARLFSDREIEVRCADGLTVVFAADEDYFRQLARLQLILRDAPRYKPDQMVKRVDLAVGAQVPIAFGAPPPPPQAVDAASSGGSPDSASAPAPTFFPPSPPATNP